MKQSKRWLLYGANGYTGELIAEEAVRRGMKPILAARRKDAVEPLATKLGLEWRVFPLERSALANNLEDVDLVLHCAGPFSKTSAPMVAGCLENRVHYLDITGEIPIFEAIQLRHQEAKKAGIALIPGVGFDVIPSDCLAALLKEKLPSAKTLELAFASSGGLSRGTMKTMVEDLSKGGCVRREGKIVHSPLGVPSKEIPFAGKTKWAGAIPWGDVSTAFHSTAIPNITVYLAMSKTMSRTLRYASLVSKVLEMTSLTKLVQNQIGHWVKGPSEETRTKAKVRLWGEVTDGKKKVSATLNVPEAYRFTVLCALAAVEKTLAGVEPGAWTPSKAFGADFVLNLPEVELKFSERAQTK